MPVNQNPEMIGQAFRQLFLQQRTLQEVQTTLLQCPERRNQVAAIHGRHETGPKRLESARVIPIEQVAARALKLGHGGQSSKCLFGEFRNGEKAKLAGHLAGVQ